MVWKANTSNARMCRSGKHTEIDQIAQRNFSNGPTSGRVVLRSKLVDRTCQVQSLVALFDLVVRRFSWFSPELT